MGGAAARDGRVQGAANGSKMNTSIKKKKKHDFVCSTISKLLKPITGNSINDCDFLNVRNFC